jgi:hypothetical protein
VTLRKDRINGETIHMNRLMYFLSILSFAVVSCRRNDSLEQLPTNDKAITQVFNINSKRDTTIVGKKGTIIKFRENSFLNSSGQEIDGEIQISIEEFYTIGDFINNRLSTNTTDGRILKSSGMVFIQAKADTSTLRLKNDHPMTIMFKSVQESPTANLFSGQSGKYNEIKWSLLEPVHNDTIVIRKETLTRVDYAFDNIEIELITLIGKDTIVRTPENEKYFDKFKLRLKEDERYSRNRRLAIGDSVTTYYSNDIDPNRFYIFETINLGYLNCDIFIEEELHDLSIKLDNSTSAMLLVLDSLNSVIYPDSINELTNDYIFKVPNNIAISIVAYRKLNEKHFFKIERTKSDSQTKQITLNEAPLDEIRNEIKKLGENTR